MHFPLVSIITVSYNSKATIADTINSVLSQSYKNIEYIVIDGSSTDGTIDIIKSYGNRISKFISEPDKGIFDAFNKGIRLAKGDIVGILNSDDFFPDSYVINKIADAFNDLNIDAVYGDVKCVHPSNLKKIVRYYSSKRFEPNKFKYGIMPAHPSFYVKREFFDRYGFYKIDYKIASDFELLIRFLYTYRIKTRYIPIPFVIMRTGGNSNKSFKGSIILNQEIARACRENGIKTNYMNIYSKYFYKIFEYLIIPRNKKS